MCDIVVLFNGYSMKINDKTMKANCSCTLIKASKLIIVDTMTAWDREKIIEALERENIKPIDIAYVVSTHSHADHIGNNNLFTNAEHIIGTCVHEGDTFYEDRFIDGEYQICPEVKVIVTPGHTSDDVTVIVEKNVDGGSKHYAITGDLFEKEEDIHDPQIWKDLGIPELRNIQSQMRSKVINLADFIVPGHGPMFPVTDEMREIVKSQVIE